MTLSLSTMWAQQERFVRDMHEFVREALAMGYDAIEISHATPDTPFERLLAYPDVPISSIHAPAPLVRHDGERANSALNLAALDDDERAAAVRYAIGSIERTHAAGGRFVVVHLGAVGNPMFEDERELRRLYDSGTREGERVEQLRAAIIARRSDEAAPWLERARATLAELARAAEALEVAIGIENRLHYHEIPQPDEAAWLLADYAPAIAGYWHDVGHAEVQWRLGLVDKHRWLDTNGARTIGTHLHDVTGLADHRAPGNGDVDWGYIRDGLPATALRVFEINQGQPAADVAKAIGFLRARGVVAG
jgi:sugar phosphate isomerase/epimerase